MDGNLLSTLNQFAEDHHLFTFYWLENIPGKHGLLGSAAAEQNHASILMFLNGGQHGIDDNCENPGNLIKALLHCQHQHVKKQAMSFTGQAKTTC